MKTQGAVLVLILVLSLCSTLVLAGDRAKGKKDENPAVVFLHKLGWHPLGEPREMPQTVPRKLNGLPFYHYQVASKAAGLDLAPVVGQSGTMYRYDLGKSPKGSNIFAHVLVVNKKVVGAWLSTDAPVAPGIEPIDTPAAKLAW